MGLYPLRREIHLKRNGNRILAVPSVPQMDMGDDAPVLFCSMTGPASVGGQKKKAPRTIPRGSVVLGDDLLSHRSGQYHRRGRA